MHVNGAALTVAVNAVDTGTSRVLALRIESVNGSFTFLMEPDAAIQVGASLREQGRNAKSGLHVPPQLDL